MKILIVDDEKIQCDLLKGFLEKQGYDVMTANTGLEALQRFKAFPFQLVILDHRMPDLNGDKVLAEMKKIDPMIRAIMITAFGTVDTAVNVMKLGADEFLEKPADLILLKEKINRIEQRLLIAEEADSVSQSLEKIDFPIHIVGEGAAMQEVFSIARRVSATPWSVLIRGETGTGKELIARLIHHLSQVKEGPFIEVNCGAIPENLFESELFGHEKGAFTGAVASRRGRFELARNGTLFLDEIGELPMSLQPKLLRAIQEKKISRVGSEKEIHTDVRVVAATNRDLKKMTATGAFREDLYYRLNVFEIKLPPLRERKEDIPLLIDFFLERYCEHPMQFHPDAMATLMKYSFAGNIRELEHIIQRTITLCRGNIIQHADLPSEVRKNKASAHSTLASRLEAVEKEMLLAALEKNGWIQTKAAESLGINERVLRYKMKKHAIEKSKG